MGLTEAEASQMLKRKAPQGDGDEDEILVRRVREKATERGGKHSDPATCNCRICVQPCQLCHYHVAIRLHKYCKTCEEEVKALTADASANGWLDDLEELHKTPSSWAAVMFDFIHQCPCHGPGLKRRKYDFDQNRVADMLRNKVFHAHLVPDLRLAPNPDC
jgi:hypothetical protein